MSRVFVDTNVLLYAEDARDRAKRTHARQVIEELVTSGDIVLSTQILQELFVAATRKLGVSATVARALVEDYSKLDVVMVRPEIVLAAIDLHRVGAISFWDALVVKCASVAGCGRLLTEDLQHGQLIDGVRIENPFLPAIRSAEPAARYRTRAGRRARI